MLLTAEMSQSVLRDSWQQLPFLYFPPVGGPSFACSLSIIYFVLDLSWLQQINPMTALSEIICFAWDNDSSLISLQKHNTYIPHTKPVWFQVCSEKWPDSGRRKKPQVDGLKIVEVKRTGHSLCGAWDSVHVTTLVSYKLYRLHWSNKMSGVNFYLYSRNPYVQVKATITTQPELCY